MKRSPLRKVSRKRASQMAQYRKRKSVFLATYPFCECTCGQHSICSMKSIDVHHMRGRTGDMLLDERYWLSICRPCHTWIHNNARQARTLKLLQ